jgi:carbamoyltransferase
MIVCHRVKKEAWPLLRGASHVDGTSRVQVLDRATNPLFYDLIRKFGEQTGTFALLNTSFNVRGQPIVCTAADAIEVFLNSKMDALALGSYLLEKGK